MCFSCPEKQYFQKNCHRKNIFRLSRRSWSSLKTRKNNKIIDFRRITLIFIDFRLGDLLEDLRESRKIFFRWQFFWKYCFSWHEKHIPEVEQGVPTRYPVVLRRSSGPKIWIFHYGLVTLTHVFLNQDYLAQAKSTVERIWGCFEAFEVIRADKLRFLSLFLAMQVGPYREPKIVGTN